MSMLQVRNVPPELHRTLKARAALVGMSLSEYVLKELARTVERPTLDELRRRLAARAPYRPDVPPAEALAEEREGR